MASKEGARVIVRVSASTAHWSVTVDLEQAKATRTVPAPPTVREIAPETLASLREIAERAHAGGDYEYRDQFADGDTEFRITLGSKTVTLRYVTDGVGRYTPVEELYDFACTCL